MKLILLLLVPVVLLASCKKTDIVTPQPVSSTTEAPPDTKNTAAARPGTPAIKGNWRLAMWAGGIMGAPPTPVTYLKRLHLRPDMTFTITSGSVTTTGVYSLSTAPIPYPPGTKNLLTLGSSTPPPGSFYIISALRYQYRMSHDSLSIVPDGGADGIAEMYVKE